MRRGAVLVAAFVALAGLAACETTPDIVFTYGAQGVEIQAQRLVSEVYGAPSDPLPYSNGDLVFAIQGIKTRWPSLKPLLDDGTVGLTDDGDVALRDASSRSDGELKSLRALVKAENRDRFFLYRGMTSATGHDGDAMASGWMEYCEQVFGKEWWRQAPKGWWLRGPRGEWVQK